jgi:2,3-dihydroxybenzoate decarboxylase
MLDAEEARGIASRANDYLAEACGRYPDRFIGMTAVAPQDPMWSAAEIKRGAELGFKGVQINSHTQGHYLDEPQFDPIFRALADTGQPLYLHPATLPDNMMGGMIDAGLDGAVFGFAVETSYHLLRLVTSGLFDRYPNLQVMAGHGCEALPYWLYRTDFMHKAGVRSNRYASIKPLKHDLFHYMRQNFLGTCSGLPFEPAIKLMIEVMGEDRGCMRWITLTNMLLTKCARWTIWKSPTRRRKSSSSPTQSGGSTYEALPHRLVCARPHWPHPDDELA